MATISENDGTNASWLKQRSTIFNSAGNKPSAKVVDKELARLKNIGAVSSVWSNKFVQEDNSGGTTENKNKRISPPPEPPLSPRERFMMLNNIDISPRPNANYIPGTRQSMTSPTPQQPISPRSPVFNNRIRTLSGSNKKMADEITAALQDDDQKDNSFGYFSKNSMSSLDLNEIKSSSRSSVTSSTISSVPTSPITSTNNDSTSPTIPTTSMDEAASLWFQCETLKTQFAQSNARLNKANQDIDFYKRQLEQNGEVARQGMATVVQDKERESLRVRQLAELIVKQDKLLGEYEINLDCLTRLTNESVYLEETKVEMDSLRQEVSALNKQKLHMEGAIASLRAELEMSYSQMRLMMLVSTEIQNEFDSYKEKINSDIKELLSKKQAEHEAQLKALQESIGVPVVSNERAVNDRDDMTNHAADATVKVTAAAAATAVLVAADTEKSLGSLRDQVTTLTETLQEKSVAVSEALQAKDKAVSEAMQANKALEEKDKALCEALQIQETTIIEMENRLKNQKMCMDAQMMELNQTILEKDTLLMEFMSSRNNSREVISAAASMSPSTVVPAAAVTDTYYHPRESESRLHINQVRDYMFSSSEDEEEESEILMMSYTTDEEEHTPQHHDHYRHIINTDTNATSTPQSPADTISSAISFDSDEEEEKIAEIKHFSYSSVQSQSTRPGSFVSSSGSISGGDDMDHKRSSLRNSSTRIAKEVKTASWPMPPPTPPPSEPLPPVPVLQVQAEIVNLVKEEVKSPIANMSNVPPPRRARSKTMARDEAPDMSVYTTSVHQNNQLPRIIPVQKAESAPVPAPRKDLASLNITQANNLGKEERQHTKWMDDPESEEDDELWCEANVTPKQTTQEW